MSTPRTTLTAALAVLVSATTSFAQRMPEPVMEFAEVLRGLDVLHQNGKLELEDANGVPTAVFLPQGARVDVIITKKGSNTPLHSQAFMVGKAAGVFSRCEQRSLHREFRFTEPGDYVATWRANGKPMTAVPFSVVFEQNNDPFNPITRAYTEGPWSRWAYLFASVNKGPDANPRFVMWVQQRSFKKTEDADVYSLELRKDGDVMAVCGNEHCGSREWQQIEFKLQHPESKGGRPIKVKELVGHDGTFDVIVRKNGELYAAFQFDVRDGQPLLHPRQASDYSPRTEYIVPRFAGLSGTLGLDSMGHTVWMERLSDSDAKAVFAGRPAAVAGPTDEDRRRWNWIPESIDPERPFKIEVTDIETRSDTGLAAGEDLIVFGTGFPTGVKYMKAGDKKAREIPDGETYSSKVFCVCGKKIVLTKKNRVLIFDTETGKLTAIPESDIFLYDVGNNLINSNGYLVATVNRATAVADRTIVKIIDVSGETPKIIPIKNANYTDRDVTSVSVDAKHGHVAIASRAKKQIAAAKIAPLANQHLFDVTDYRGVSSFDITIEDDFVTYADDDWKVRLLDLRKGIPEAVTEQPIARSGNGFWVRKGRTVVVTTDEKVGSRYRMALTDGDGAPRPASGTGTPIEGTSAGLGMGGSAAIAIDKTVFIAGDPGDSIGVGEHLQMFQDDRGWIPITGPDGKVIQGSEVVTSMGFLAFKVRNAEGRTVLGYATYGQRIESGGSTSVASTGSRPEPNGPVRPVTFEKEDTHSTRDESEESYLVAMLDNEEELLKPYKLAFGDQAEARALKNMVDIIGEGDYPHLVDEFKRRSSLVAGKDKPKAPALPKSDADPRAVDAALAGQWRPLRFEIAGEDLPDGAEESLRLTLAQGQYVLLMGGNIESGTYDIDTSTAPHAMTITVGMGSNKGQVRRGSFKLLEDDRLLVVFATDDSERPTRFVSDEQNPTLLAVYTRVK